MSVAVGENRKRKRGPRDCHTKRQADLRGLTLCTNVTHTHSERHTELEMMGRNSIQEGHGEPVPGAISVRLRVVVNGDPLCLSVGLCVSMVWRFVAGNSQWAAGYGKRTGLRGAIVRFPNDSVPLSFCRSMEHSKEGDDALSLICDR